jgi:hypothetical protein
MSYQLPSHNGHKWAQAAGKKIQRFQILAIYHTKFKKMKIIIIIVCAVWSKN